MLIKKICYRYTQSFLFSHNHFILILIPSKEKINCLIKNYPIVFRGKNLKIESLIIQAKLHNQSLNLILGNTLILYIFLSQFSPLCYKMSTMLSFFIKKIIKNSKRNYQKLTKLISKLKSSSYKSRNSNFIEKISLKMIRYCHFKT